MYSLRLPTGDFLEGTFDLTFELNNQVFSTSDTDVLPGSYSYPFDVAGTRRNRSLLGSPHLVTNARNFREWDGAWIYCYGVALFGGTLMVLSAVDGPTGNIKLTLVVNPLRDIRNKKLPLLASLQTLTMGSGDLLGHMLDTANNPEDFNHVFFPVRLTGVVPDEVNTSQPFHNYWDEVAQEFTADTRAYTPYVAVRHVIAAISADADLSFVLVNEWQTRERELQRLYLFNNADLRVSPDEDSAPVFDGTIALKNHVPNVTVSEFLRGLSATFALGIFTDVFARRIRIRPLNRVMAAATARDWTRYHVGTTPIDKPTSPPDRYAYSNSDGLPPGWPDVDSLTTYYSQDEAWAALNVPDKLGTYAYLAYLKSAVKVTKVNVGFLNPDLTVVPLEQGVTISAPVENTFTPPNEGVRHSWFYYFNDRAEITGYQSNGETPPKYEFQNADFPLALMWYRGVQGVEEGGFGDRWPLASDNVYRPFGDPLERVRITSSDAAATDAQYSLNWHGPRGLYNVWHRRWRQMLGGKPCTLTFHLPVAELVQFAFDEKVRVGQMEYFFKRLRVGKAIGRGLVQVEASGVTVI